MTILEGIINWLLQFEPQEYGRMKNIQADMLPARVNSYSLAKEPVQNRRTAISGRVTHTDHYTLHARLSANENGNRLDNATWGVLLEKWVQEKNKSRHFPEIDGILIRKVDITSPFARGIVNDREAVYQMTISIEYNEV